MMTIKVDDGKIGTYLSTSYNVFITYLIISVNLFVTSKGIEHDIIIYYLISKQGWTKDPDNNQACTKDVDECKDNSHTCSSNPLVECRNTRGSFTCGSCPEGEVYVNVFNIHIT